MNTSESKESWLHILLFQKELKKAESALRARVLIDDARVEGWLALSEHFHYYEEDLPLALQYIDKALEVAIVADEFVRQVLGVRIRIALALKNYETVERSLLMLVEYQSREDGLDVEFETDFITLIPADSVSPHVLMRYKELIDSRPVRG